MIEERGVPYRHRGKVAGPGGQQVFRGHRPSYKVCKDDPALAWWRGAAAEGTLILPRQIAYAHSLGRQPERGRWKITLWQPSCQELRLPMILTALK